MPRTSVGITDSGGVYLETEDENGDVRRVELTPTTNGMVEIAVETPDGTRKVGEVEPGTAGDKGIGN